MNPRMIPALTSYQAELETLSAGHNSWCRCKPCLASRALDAATFYLVAGLEEGERRWAFRWRDREGGHREHPNLTYAEAVESSRWMDEWIPNTDWEVVIHGGKNVAAIPGPAAAQTGAA